AASAAVSGTSMAAVGEWTPGGEGGSFEMRGTLVVAGADANPWEVKVGDAVTGLDAQIQEGQKEANIAVNKAIPFLGIRTIESTAFHGQLGISPQIDFGNAVNVDAFENGRAPVTLEVKDADNAKIGTLTASMGASALTSVKGPWSGYNYNYSESAGQGFFGGLPKNKANTPDENIAYSVMPEIAAHYVDQGVEHKEVGVATEFANTKATYSGYYGSGIEQGKTIKITLDEPAGTDEITWKASLPVTVIYM
ncbi:F4 family fimbrial subunit, partial [Escherichia sp. MOD1-EC5449]